MSRTRSFLSVAVLLSAALPCAALDFLSPEEEAELELKRKKEADPVLTCAPVRLNASVRKDEKTSARLTVLNAGGRTLQWSVTSAPEWASPDPKGGELGFEGRQDLVLSIDPSALPDGATRGEIVIEAPEFTSVCPKTGQPDFGTLLVTYTPDKDCIELKSLKLYLQQYRSQGIFYEEITNRILDDLVRACRPRRMRLVSSWRPRGGISTVVTVDYAKP